MKRSAFIAFLLSISIFLVPFKSYSNSDSPFGIGAYLYRVAGFWDGWNKQTSLQSIRKRAKFVNNLNAVWIRENFFWHRNEDLKYMISYTDNIVQVAEEERLHIIGLVDGFTTEPSPQTNQDFNSYAEKVAEYVERYKGRISHWQIWNEPDSFDFWKPRIPPATYTQLLKKAYTKAKQIDPSIKVLGLTIDSGNLEYIEGVFKRGGLNYMDIIAVHPYSYPLTFETSWQMQAIPEIKRLMNKYGEEKPIWVTEVGVPTHAGGVSERRQAELIVRIYLSLFSAGVEKVLWYDLVDDEDNRSNPEFNFGLLKTNLSPKISFQVYKTMTTMLNGYKFVKEINIGEDNRAILFKNGMNEEILVAWTYAEEVDERGNVISFLKQNLPLVLQRKIKEVYDIFGKKISHFNGVISPSPVYFKGMFQTYETKYEK